MWRFPVGRLGEALVRIHAIDSSLTHKSEILTSSSSAAVETTVGTGVAAGDNVVGETILCNDRQRKEVHEQRYEYIL